MSITHTDQAAPTGPLAGVRVLDLTRVVMGPLATQILADQGAEVILVEANGGDTNRVMGDGPHPQFSGISLNILRNKRSVAIDLKSREGLDLVYRIAATCDVVVATMRPHVLERLGLSYADFRRVRSDIIYCQGQGFPLDSDQAEEPAYDDIIQAATGVADIMSLVFDERALMPTILADKVSGLYMAQAITAALLHRERTGMGQHVEIAMVRAMSAFLLVEHGAGAISEPPMSKPGYHRILSKERKPHPTLDGWIHVQPYLPKHYKALFAESGRADLLDETRYVDKRASLKNSDSLYRDVRAVLAHRTTQEWLDFCHQAGIPATPVASLDDMVDALPKSEHPVVGTYRVVPPAARFSRDPEWSVRRAAPMIGEHTQEVTESFPDSSARLPRGQI